MKYVATGTGKRKSNNTGEVEVVNVLLPLTAETHASAVAQAKRIAKRDKVTLDVIAVRPVQGSGRQGGILTKNNVKRK